MSYRVALLFIVALVLPRPALAQAKPPSFWGAVVSVTPSWTVANRTNYYFGGGDVDMEGSEFTIGVARGREFGSDWGVTYMQTKVKEGSLVSDLEENCDQFSNGCFKDGEEKITLSGVTLNGLKVHKFYSFLTIKERVQLGLNASVGFGQYKGNIEKHEYQAEFVSFNSQTQKAVGRQGHTVEQLPASELFFAKNVPVGDLQAAATVIIVPGLKVRVASGIGWPGDHTFTLTGVYLFGVQ